MNNRFEIEPANKPEHADADKVYAMIDLRLVECIRDVPTHSAVILREEVEFIMQMDRKVRRAADLLKLHGIIR